jgi:hypothetical protein
MTEYEFDLPPKASADVITQRNELADAVCHEALRAGLPAHRGDLRNGPDKAPGVQVHVEPFVMGGVYVNWNTDKELRDAAIELFARGFDRSDPPPAFRHYGIVNERMRDALLGILTSAGFEVEESDPHTHGDAIRVTGFRI